MPSQYGYHGILWTFFKNVFQHRTILPMLLFFQLLSLCSTLKVFDSSDKKYLWKADSQNKFDYCYYCSEEDRSYDYFIKKHQVQECIKKLKLKDQYERDNELFPACDRGQPPVCPPLTAVPNGDWYCNSSEFIANTSSFNHTNVPVYQSCYLTCHKGYQLIGESEAECNESRLFQNDIPTCEIQVCPPLPDVLDGAWDCTPSEFIAHPPLFNHTNVPVYQSCFLTCHKGYQLIGRSEAECNESRSFKNDIPTCVIEVCPPLPDVLDGAWDCTPSEFIEHSPPFNHTNVPVYQSCFLTCHKGYQLIGRSEAECNESRSFKNDIPTCVIEVCPPLPDVLNGAWNCTSPDCVTNPVAFNYTNVPVYQSCKLTCSEGYQVMGQPVAECNESRLFHDDIPTCQKIPTEPTDTESDALILGVPAGAGSALIAIASLMFAILRFRSRNPKSRQHSNSTSTNSNNVESYQKTLNQVKTSDQGSSTRDGSEGSPLLKKQIKGANLSGCVQSLTTSVNGTGDNPGAQDVKSDECLSLTGREHDECDEKVNPDDENDWKKEMVSENEDTIEEPEVIYNENASLPPDKLLAAAPQAPSAEVKVFYPNDINRNTGGFGRNGNIYRIPEGEKIYIVANGIQAVIKRLDVTRISGQPYTGHAMRHPNQAMHVIESVTGQDSGFYNWTARLNIGYPVHGRFQLMIEPRPCVAPSMPESGGESSSLSYRSLPESQIDSNRLPTGQQGMNMNLAHSPIATGRGNNSPTQGDDRLVPQGGNSPPLMRRTYSTPLRSALPSGRLPELPSTVNLGSGIPSSRPCASGDSHPDSVQVIHSHSIPESSASLMPIPSTGTTLNPDSLSGDTHVTQPQEPKSNFSAERAVSEGLNNLSNTSSGSRTCSVILNQNVHESLIENNHQDLLADDGRMETLDDVRVECNGMEQEETCRINMPHLITNTFEPMNPNTILESQTDSATQCLAGGLTDDVTQLKQIAKTEDCLYQRLVSDHAVGVKGPTVCTMKIEDIPQEYKKLLIHLGDPKEWKIPGRDLLKMEDYLLEAIEFHRRGFVEAGPMKYILDEMTMNLYKIGHLVYIYSRPESRRPKIIDEIKQFHGNRGCPFCQEYFDRR